MLSSSRMGFSMTRPRLFPMGVRRFFMAILRYYECITPVSTSKLVQPLDNPITGVVASLSQAGRVPFGPISDLPPVKGAQLPMAKAAFQPVRKESISEEVAAQIRKEILRGTYVPGEKLPSER
ncbi:MAG: GntR family transcriptional regulator, partial [Chrysiogenetes bacterium]|nr:GntR family transcriptional regulator [Chrysiogenetes bacterium]